MWCLGGTLTLRSQPNWTVTTPTEPALDGPAEGRPGVDPPTPVLWLDVLVFAKACGSAQRLALNVPAPRAPS